MLKVRTRATNFHMQSIDELYAAGSITLERADDAKAKYARLHAALTDAMQRETQLLDKARALKRQGDSEKV
jgi:hypothetical protein